MTSFEITDNDLVGVKDQAVIITGKDFCTQICKLPIRFIQFQQVHHLALASQPFAESFNRAARSSQAISTLSPNPKYHLSHSTKPT
jgi:hypothetical protein